MLSYSQEHDRVRTLLEGIAERNPDGELEDCTCGESWFDRLAWHAGLSQREKKLVRLRFMGSVLALLLLIVLVPLVIALSVFGLSLAIEYVRLTWKATARVQKFDKDYTALLLSLASAVKTGMDPMSALLSARELFEEESEVYRQLQQVNEESEKGLPEDEVIQSFASSIAHPDLGLFRTAFVLARREGSSLAHCLQRLAKVTRQRQSFRRKVKAAVAMQKLSAYGIAGCACFIVGMQIVSNPESIHTAWNHPVGIKLLIFGGFLMCFGLAWMVRVARCEE